MLAFPRRPLLLLQTTFQPVVASVYSWNTANFDLDRRAATLEDRMHHLETLIQAIPPAVFAAGGAGASPAPHSPIDPSTNPHASFANSTHIFPTAVPPPSLTSYPLMNPSTFFAPVRAARHSSPSFSNGQSGTMVVDSLTDDTARMSLSSSYLYFDDEGYTRWQGETSGLPLLDLLVERHNQAIKPDPERGQAQAQAWTSQNGQAVSDWFPDRTSKRVDNNPEAVWKLITSFIAPELMDRFVVPALAYVTMGIDICQSGAMFLVDIVLPLAILACTDIPLGTHSIPILLACPIQWSIIRTTATLGNGASLDLLPSW